MIFSKSFKKILLLAISVLLILISGWYADPEKLIHTFSKFDFPTIIKVLLIFFFNLFLVSFRLSRILDYFKINLAFNIAFKASLQGHFASLFFVSLIGQVVGRQSVLRHYDTKPVLIAALTAIERGILFAVSAAFALFGAVYIIDTIDIITFLNSISYFEILFVASVGYLFSLWFGKTKFEHRLFNNLLKRQRLIQLTELILITSFAQGLVIGAFVIVGLSMAPEIGFLKLFAAAALTSFAASLPISVNGWGIREITAIFAFGAIGMSEPIALATSILIGLCSTAVVLATYPYIFTKSKNQKHCTSNFSSNFLSKPNSAIEKSSTYLLICAATICIFFQVHVSLPHGLININLSDPFAILSLAAVGTRAFFKRQLPQWSASHFNLFLVVFTCLLVFSFLNGVNTIGVTQWAFTSRIMGWLVLLGYLSLGILAASYFRKIVIKRFIESLISTAIIVIFFQIFMRFLIFFGLLDTGGESPNFEGFAGNRNAFAFQLLTCSVLLLAYTVQQKKSIQIFVGKLNIQSEQIAMVAHGIILLGIALTGSKAGILTGLIILIFSCVTKFTNFNFLKNSLLYGLIFWSFFALFLPWFFQNFLPTENTNFFHAIQSEFSYEHSNKIRWQTILYGFEMWKDSPWLGAGLGVFAEMSSQWFKEKTVIHSTPVWILAEFGLIGAVILFYIVSRILVSIVRAGIRKPAERAAVMLFLVFVVFGLVHEIFYQRIFWLAVGFCLAAPFQTRFRERFNHS